MSGWFRVYRILWDKSLWIESTPEQKAILFTLLSMANHSNKQWEWRGEKYNLEPGQFITSLESIVKKSGRGISIQNVRTALKRFKKLGFLTVVPTNKNTLITIVNWEFYQERENYSTNKITSKQQATNKQLTTNKNEKKINNVNNNSFNDRKVYDSDSVPFNLTIRLLKKIRLHHQEFKEPNLQKWSDDFNTMLENDLRKPEEITYLIDWCQQDSFWKSIILSPSKIRQKYDQLVILSKSERGSSQNRGGHQISLNRPSHWEEPKALSQEEMQLLRKIEDEF
jgi:hypothetical protein